MGDQPIAIPPDYARRVRELAGEAGAAWLARLPGIVAACAERWALRLDPPFPLSYNYVVPAWRAGEPVVLKVELPEAGLGEIDALELFDGHGSTRLLAVDREQGALLLERLLPGTTLAALGAGDDERATLIAADVMRRLWRPAPTAHGFRTLTDRAAELATVRRRFAGGTGPLREGLVARAESLFAELIASAAPPVLLHGDLHHGNILAAAREPWLAIDPKGVVGEPAAEVGPLLLNPRPDLLSWPHPERVLARRLDILAAALGFERERLWAWGLAHALLSAWWSVEDFGAGWEYAVGVAELLAGMEG
ncbi:MAG TPA: aminoglycoside phosphotransferase family protein [Thermomicrobiaceae bacterium]|nr:aminoglycoside phosphotransferase family protein [Thermomicrobiaceae bacterium]